MTDAREAACTELEGQVHVTLRDMLQDMRTVTFTAHVAHEDPARAEKQPTRRMDVTFRFSRYNSFVVKSVEGQRVMACQGTILDGMGLALCGDQLTCMIAPTDIVDRYTQWRKRVTTIAAIFCRLRYGTEATLLLLRWLVPMFVKPTQKIHALMLQADKLYKDVRAAPM